MLTNVIKKLKSNIFTDKQSAFTLAEVVIALVVLGVIASTLTGVVYFSRKDINHKDLVATLQSQVIKLNRSYKIALAENDDLDRWVYKNPKDNSVEKMRSVTQAKQNEMFAKVWESYFPSTKVCGAGTTDTCFPKSTVSGEKSVNYNAKSDYYKMRTADGASIAIKISDHMCRGTGVNGRDKGVCGEIIIDINGNKGPNKEGMDTYRLGIFHNGIRPFTGGCGDPLNSANVVLTTGETCYEDFNVTTCPKDKPYKCHNCDGKIVCVADEKACSALQKAGGCAPETCPSGTISYYVDGNIQCIPEDQKNCYEQIKLNPEYKWDPVTKKCLSPKENCEKNGGYWEAGKEICWDSPEHMCTTKQQVYIPKPNQTPNFECISQEEYCKREVRKDGTGGLGGWLWKNNVCCTATSVAANVNATCCNAYSDVKGGSHSWWDGTSACCTSNTTEACCKSTEDGHEAGFWANGKCWKDPKTQCEKPAPEGLGGIWISSTNSCCTTKIVDNTSNPKYCFASEKDKCNAPSDKGGKGGWYVASADKCCTSETDAQVCCKGIWRTYNGNNYCYENEKAVCVAPTANAGIGGWWVPEATTGYNTYSGCCTSEGTQVCCNGLDKNHWWAESTKSCCQGPIEATKSCCESAENGHESKYWTSTPSQCWTSASQFCITATSSNGLGGWNWIGDAKSGVCCTDTSKTTRSNDSGNGNIQHQGQFDRLLTDDYSKRCCINESTLNGHSRFIWYTNNYKGNSGYCWDTINNLCQQQTDTSDDHGLGGWYWDGTDCCSINTTADTIKYWTKGNIKANPPTLESTVNVSVKNESDRSTKSCCTNVNSKGKHTRYNWTDKNYAGKGGYCWFDDEELCQKQTDSGNDHGMGGWYWDKASNHCCTSEYDVNVNTNNKSQTVFRKGATSAQVLAYNQRNDSNKACCTNSNTKGKHTRFIWTAKAYADTRGYCWLDNNELCQDQTDNNTYNHDAGMGGWFWDSANNVCCTIRTTAAQDINVKGGSASKVNVNNQSNNSNKNCCTNTNTKGDHTRFNWTDKTYANNGGYCWLNDAELCQSQTGLNDHGMGGWYWDSATSMCCTSKYDTSITTAPKSQEVFRKGATSAQVKVYNQQNASNKACCTNSNAKGGHTRFNWTDKNYAGNGGYCWLDDSELCQTQTDKASTYGKDFGMGGWAWDSSSNRCCTSKYDTNIKSSNSTQKKYTKGGSSATVSAYNQQNDSNKFCCTNSNTKGGHTRFNWTANNYASSGGYCWLNDEELCQSQTDASRIYGKDYGMGGWLWDNASNSCCTIKTTSNQPVFRKGGSSASVVVKNESGNSNKNCCTNSNTKGGHTRFNWTDSTNVSGSKGYCWLNDSELCTDQTNGMGGWFWDSSANRCCTIKYDTSITTAPKSQTVYRKGASSATVTIYNQQNASNKACCTNSNTAGGHTRFNWTDNNYAGSGGYCWNDDSELCQTQTDKASTYGKDHGMGGWAWDSSANTCCTIKTTRAQTKYVKGGSSATVAVKNQQASSSKFCCTNSNTKGGHTRFNWIDNNYASKGGYCWLNDAELCQDQTDSSNDHGMGGWLWDSSANVCCTIKTTSSQTKYVKGGSSASVNVKNQSSSSNKACCTSTQTKGGHTRFNWTDNNYAGKGGYCWLDDAELCQSQTGLVDHGMGGWLWDSTNNVCCTVKTTSAQTKYVKGGSSARVNVKNQSNDSTRQCCTSTQTKGGHINTFWSSTTSKDNAGYCWNSKADFCKSTLSAGLKGWDYDSTNNQCCTNDTTTNSSYWNTHYYSAMTKKDQGGYSTEYCCTSTSTSNGHTNFNWINGKCWNSNSGFCTDTIANKGANGWYQDGSNCCTNSKTGTETVKGKGGTTSTITYKNNSDNSTAECCRKRGSNTRAYWLNSYCWSTLDEYCKSTNSSGARGYYSYTSSGTNYCCTNNKSGSLSGKNNGSSYSVTYKGNSAGAQTTKECCVNATSGAKTYINNRCWNNLNGYCTTSSSSGGAGGYYQYGSNCCVASGSESSVTTYGGSSASSSSTLYIKNENSTKTCCHNKTGTTWYSTSSETGGTCCTNDNGSKACCESSQNGHTAGTWSESAKTCCFDADVSEACCKAIKGSDAYMAGGKCCASKDQSASCCQGFCGDAYNYKNNSCTCVTCEDGEYIPEDSSGNVLAAKCCVSKNDDETCCTAANAPGNTSGNYFYATTMCCASGNTSAECCAKYASNSGKSRFGYYDSHCTLLDSNQIYVCAVFNTSKFSSVAVGPTAVIRSSGGCTGISGTSADVVITGAGTGVSNRYGGTNVSGNGCSFIDSPQDSPYNGAGKVSWSSSTANGNYTCVLSPYGDDCSGWYESSSSNTCCTSDNTSACCASSLNPSGSGTWVTSGSVCCYDATISDACCKAMNNSNYYLEGSTCCASGNSSSACCTSSSNPKGAGKKYVASGSVCCYSESDSDACCKAIKGSSYSLYGSTCSTEEPCSGWLTGSTCCTSDSTKTCCEASNNPDGAGTWASNTCCQDKNASDKCCLAMSDDNYWYAGSCKTVASGFDVRVEYNSSISEVTVAGTFVANKGVKNVSSAAGTAIVATPASGNTFNQWEVVDGGCTITSATSASTTISGATSGSKYCVIKPTAIAQETQEFSVALVSPTSASSKYNIVLYNSSNNEILNLNNGTVSASSVPSGEYTLRIGTFSFGTGGVNLTNSSNANLSATVSGNCTIGDKQYSSNSSSDIGSKWIVTLPNSGDNSCNITVNVGEPSSGGGGSSGCTGTYTMTAKTPDKYTFAPYGYSGTSQHKLYAKYSASSTLIDTKNEIYEGKRTGISCGTATTSVEFSYTYPDTSTGAQNYLEISGPCKFVAVGSSSTSFAGQVEVTSPNAGDVTCTFTPKNCGSICSWVGTNGKCCASENSKECCEGASRVIPAYSCTHQKGTWASSSSTCCHSANVSYNCCKAIMGESATWNGSSCSGGSSGGGTTIKSYGIVVTPNNGITSITVDGNKVTTGGTSLTITSSSPTVNISAEVKGGYSFDKWSVSQGCNFSSGSSISTPTKLTFANVNEKSASSYMPCILNAYANDSCDGWLTGSTCCTSDSTKTCCEASNNPDGAGTWASNTCCQDKNASDKCCLAMSDDNYWYDGSCYTVSSGIDIYAEYGSDISGVTIAGTGVSNRNKVHVDNGAGTAIVATPASGNTFSSWYSTNCTITSATSASTTIASVTSGAKFCIVEPKAVESETNEFTISIDTSGIVSTDKYSYCINSPDDDDMDRYCNDNSLLYAIEGDSSVNLPAGTYKFVVASKGSVPDLTAYFGDNLTATATGDCTITPDGNYSYNGKHYYKKWTVTSTGACTIKPHSDVAISDTTIVIGEHECTSVTYAKTYMGDTKKSCDATGNTVGLNGSSPQQFTLEHGKTTVLCCLVTSNNVVRNYYYDAPDGGLSSYPEKSEKSDGYDGVMLTGKCFKAGGCTVTVNIGRKITYKPRTKIIGCGDQGYDSYNVASVSSGSTADIIPNLIDGYTVRDMELASSCEGLKITGKYLKQDPPLITVKSTCSKPESDDPAAATCECKVCTYTNLNSGGKKTTMTVDGSHINFSTGTKPYTVDMPLGTSKTFAATCADNYIFKGWSCSGEGYAFQDTNGASNTFFNVRATDCGKTTCTASCYGTCEYCSGWLASSSKCCTAEDSEDCCQTNITNNAGHTAGTWDATNNVCCHSATSSDACCKAISGSDYSLSGGNCKKGNTTGNWFFNWTIKDTSNFKKFIISTKYVTDYSADGGCSAGSSPASGSCALDTNVPKIVAACKNTTSPVISIDRNDFKTYFDDTVYADGVTTNYLSISPITDSSDPNYSTSSSMVVNITMDCLECQNAYFTVSTDTADNFEYFEDASGNSFFDECKTGSGNKCIASGGAASFDIGCKSGTVPAITVPSGSADYELFSPEEETSEGNLYFVRSCQNVYEAKIDCLAVTEDEWNDGGCTVSGSASVQLSSSAPSSCSFSVGGSTISSSAITIPSGTLTMTCSRGAYVPTISGACCSLTNCSVGSTTVTCNTSWGSNSDCLLSAESCAAGWVGNAGGCCYSDNSKSCCEAPSQSSSSISHTQGSYINSECCTSAEQSQNCCKAIKGSSAVYNALKKTCK